MGAVRHLAFLGTLAAVSCGSYGAEDAPIGVPDRDAGGAADATNADAAADATAPCVPRSERADDSFASLDATRWLASRNVANEDSPKAGSVNNELYVYMLASGSSPNARGGLWWTRTLPFGAFDVSFELFASCGGGTCDADFAVVWLESATDAELASGVDGKAPGIPNGRSGAAVVFDLSAASSTLPQSTGKISILDVDGAATSPPTVLASSAPSPNLANGRYRVDIELRDKQISVLLDGMELVSTKAERLATEGRFGFVAARPGQGAFYVRDLKSSFHACGGD